MIVVWVPARGENHEGAIPIEAPIKGYRHIQTAMAVCRREQQKPGFGRTDYTTIWRIEVDDGTHK